MPLIAATAARYWQQHEWLNSPYRKYTPWALADAARVSLALRHRVQPARTPQTRTCCRILNAYNRFDDPFRRDHDLRAFILRMAGEQTDLAGPRVRDARPDGGHIRPDPAAPADGMPAARLGHRAVRLHAARVRRDRPAGLGQRSRLRGTVRPGSIRHSGRQGHRPPCRAGHRHPRARRALRDQHRAVPRRKPGRGGPGRPGRPAAPVHLQPAARPSPAHRVRRRLPVPAPPAGLGQGRPVGRLLHRPRAASATGSPGTWGTCSSSTSAASCGCCPARRSCRRSPTAPRPAAARPSTGSSSCPRWCCWWK